MTWLFLALPLVYLFAYCHGLKEGCRWSSWRHGHDYWEVNTGWFSRFMRGLACRNLYTPTDSLARTREIVDRGKVAKRVVDR